MVNNGSYYAKPKCLSGCSNSRIQNTRLKASSAAGYLQSNNNVAIMNEIVNYGPVVATFDAYTDLFYYKSGIYTKNPNAVYVGGHCVEIVGYNNSAPIPYWIVKNSWNANWGINGFFYIAMSTAKVNFEKYVLTGTGTVKVQVRGGAALERQEETIDASDVYTIAWFVTLVGIFAYTVIGWIFKIFISKK